MKKIVLILACITMSMSGTFSQNKCKMNVATYNLRLDTPSDSLNSWSHRKEMVKSLIRFHDFDIFGTQEGFKHQLDGILELGNYAYTGAGRDDGKDAGEHSAVFYKTDRFELLKSGNFWYSETPTLPSKGWDATCCNRICSWGKFREKKTGREFYFFNSHFDHQGKVARHNSSLLLLAKIKEIAGNLPVFCTGDFNATPDDAPIQVIYKDGKLRDSYQITKEPPYGTFGTFNNFDLHSPSNERIDYIWVTDGIVVKKYGVLNEQQYGRFPSDHFPVMVKVSF